MNVMVTGGAGYIGSHTTRELLDQGHTVLVLDNLSNGHRWAVDPRAEFIEGSLGDNTTLEKIFRAHQIEAIIHFAAFIEVGESVVDPAKYYHNNFANALVLLEAMRTAQVKKIVFSSTAAVYGEPRRSPIEESDERLPINPYGRSKMMVELALEDFSKAYGLGYAILRYFNVAGAHPSAEIGEAHHPETHLIPRILINAKEGKPCQIYGTDYPTPDKTCVRDYVHVVDLAVAHVLALDKLQPGKGNVFNLGSENGFSVREVIQACEKITGRPIEIQDHPRRPGDPAVLVASSRKFREAFSWKPRYPDLETIVRHAWAWHSKSR